MKNKLHIISKVPIYLKILEYVPIFKKYNAFDADIEPILF
jgi:hypothetical protein